MKENQKSILERQFVRNKVGHRFTNLRKIKIQKICKITEISVRTGQGHKSLLDALRQHCIRNRHVSFMETIAWGQEDFQKSVSAGYLLAVKSWDEHAPETLSF